MSLYLGGAELSKLSLSKSDITYKEYLEDNSSSIVIPNYITKLCDYCFYAGNYKSINIPTSIESIGSYCFGRCISLTNITIPNSVLSIGSNCFNSCSNLQTITINKSENSIEGAPWGATNATIVWNG